MGDVVCVVVVLVDVFGMGVYVVVYVVGGEFWMELYVLCLLVLVEGMVVVLC